MTRRILDRSWKDLVQSGLFSNLTLSYNPKNEEYIVAGVEQPSFRFSPEIGGQLVDGHPVINAKVGSPVAVADIYDNSRLKSD